MRMFHAGDSLRQHGDGPDAAAGIAARFGVTYCRPS